MNAAGIICEYNPFHNGHMLHINATREKTGCEYVIAAMSGAFTQRGDPAICDKWTRARMALKCGADVVIELPAAFAVRPADRFALGGVWTLSYTGCEYLSFGCETSDAGILETLAKVKECESSDFSQIVKDGLDKGYSHAKARGLALSETAGISPDVLNKPNTALAIEYAAVNAKLPNPMKLVPIRREGDYHDTELALICSASAIRKAVYEGQDCSGAMPICSYELLKSQFPDKISRPDVLDELILYALRNYRPENLAALPDSGEGAYMLLKKHAFNAFSRENLLALAKCKRYTMSRLNRMTIYALLGLEKSRLERIERPPYLRVLGFRRSSAKLLRQIKEISPVPLITDPMRLKGDDCFEIENMYTDLWALTAKNPTLRKAGQDYTGMIVIED